MKPKKITRIMRILTALQAGECCNVNDLGKMFGASRRTIFRDLKELENIGVPYHFDNKDGTYTMDPDFFLPPIDLTLQEALSLLLVVHNSFNQMQMPYEDSALAGVLKISSNLPIKTRQYCSAAIKNVSTRTHAGAPMAGLSKTFTLLQQAVMNKQKVALHYDSIFDKQVIKLTLCPCHLMYNHRAWYVLGFSSLHDSIRMFKLNRVKKIKLLTAKFIEDKKFELYEHLGRAWSMIPEGQLYNIKLRFAAKVARNVTEVSWHSTQQVTHNPDGSATVDFRIDGLGEIIWWVLGYGDQVEVLAPKALRDRVIKAAKKMIKINERV
ncbi:helix-turn-helix transcriptional regulator [Planctomycetota bacterium]